jgi:4'-phosphopantetheinyl transferase EntD
MPPILAKSLRASPPPHRAATLIAQLFDCPVVTAEATPSDVDEFLFPEELAYLQHALPKRRFEFGTARQCARRALAALGVAPTALLPRRDRAPAWPDGIVGSISHTDDYCAVAVALSPPLRSIGLDVEMLQAVESRLIPVILTTREIAVVEAQPEARRDALIVLHFSAKEAYYKCQYPVTEQFLHFHDVELVFDTEHDASEFGCFIAHRRTPGLACVQRLEGKFTFADGKVLCGVELLPSS